VPGTTPVGDWGAYLTLDDVDGVPFTFTFYGYDGVGNRSAPETRNVRLDGVPPVLSVTQVTDTVALSDYERAQQRGIAPTPILTGTVTDGGAVDQVVVRILEPDNAVRFVDAEVEGTNWQWTPTLTQEGVHVLNVEAWDVAGNVSGAGPFILVVQSDVPTAVQIDDLQAWSAPLDNALAGMLIFFTLLAGTIVGVRLRRRRNTHR
jgi:hypothetical protein